MFDTIIDNCGTAFEVFYLKGLIHFKTDSYNKQTRLNAKGNKTSITSDIKNHNH